ncbi:MAG: SPOR domain-containing protein, partial [Spirochaetes bacterium]|nr:SPOR domain-containing protein [Spirochaetota bacterium]
TRDNVMEPVMKKPAAKRSTLTASDAKRILRSADPEPSARHIRKATVKGDTKKKKNARSKVVAVSGDRDDYTRTTGDGGYTVQVASLDTKQRALAEVRSLREKRYDAYLDFTQINGKKFYRVRVGPFASKTKALDLLREFQEKERYRESYMVRE